MASSATTARRPGEGYAPRLKHSDHQKLWRMVEGAVVDAMKTHPEYVTEAGWQKMVGSVTKRVVGAIVSAGGPAGGRDGGC